jgi:hypothetical protein
MPSDTTCTTGSLESCRSTRGTARNGVPEINRDLADQSPACRNSLALALPSTERGHPPNARIPAVTTPTAKRARRRRFLARASASPLALDQIRDADVRPQERSGQPQPLLLVRTNAHRSSARAPRCPSQIEPESPIDAMLNHRLGKGVLAVVLWTAAMTEDQEDGVALTMSEPPFQLEVDPGMAGRAAP